MALRLVKDDTIEIGGADISNRVFAWKLNNAVGEVRTVELSLLVDDYLKINGKTISEMLDHN